jgi:hypothetical protein
LTTTTHVPQRGNPVALDFEGRTDDELETMLRDLAVSAGFSEQGSVARNTAVKHMRAIDQELARRAAEQSI